MENWALLPHASRSLRGSWLLASCMCQRTSIMVDMYSLLSPWSYLFVSHFTAPSFSSRSMIELVVALSPRWASEPMVKLARKSSRSSSLPVNLDSALPMCTSSLRRSEALVVSSLVFQETKIAREESNLTSGYGCLSAWQFTFH